MPGRHIFISYSHSDSVFVDRLVKKFRKLKLSTWRDVEKLIPGQEWQPGIDSGLRTAGAVVVVLSKKSTESQYVGYEWAFAMGAGVPVIPVAIEEPGLAPIHPRLRVLQCADFTGAKKPWLRLVDALDSQTAKLREQAGPRIRAEFEMRGGKPRRAGDEYVILLSIGQPPAGTTRAVYEIHDDSFAKEERRWPEANPKKSFSTWMQSYGDVLLSVDLETAGGVGRIEETLHSALRRTYAGDNSRVVEKALEDIGAN